MREIMLNPDNRVNRLERDVWWLREVILGREFTSGS